MTLPCGANRLNTLSPENEHTESEYSAGHSRTTNDRADSIYQAVYGVEPMSSIVHVVIFVYNIYLQLLVIIYYSYYLCILGGVPAILYVKGLP